MTQVGGGDRIIKGLRPSSPRLNQKTIRPKADIYSYENLSFELKEAINMDNAIIFSIV
jgi:hypothetical protein